MKLIERRTPPLLMAIYGIATCGVVFLLILLVRVFSDPIGAVDETALLTRKGRRFQWASLRNARAKAEFNRRSGPDSMPIFWRVDFEFEGGKVAFNPQSYENGFEVLAFIEKVTGRVFGRPKPRRETPIETL